MKKKTIFSSYSIIFFGLFFLLNSSCSKEDNIISDDEFYTQIAYTMLSCYLDIYNQNLAGHPVGNQNLTVNGPMGGTVVITGTTNYSSNNGITSVDLLYSMSSVRYLNSYNGYDTDITLTGSSSHTGTFSSSYATENFQSNNLTISGSVTKSGVVREINMTGSTSTNRSFYNVTATIFGHSVSW